MSYKVFLFDFLTPIGWSQATWRIEGPSVPTSDCPEKSIHDVLIQHLPKDGRIVEAGCGSGKWPIYLRRLGYNVLGLDISLDACALGHAADPGLGIAAADVRRLPLRSDSLDAVVSLGVVEHDEAGPMPALQETRRVLRKPDGLLVLSVPYDNLLRRIVFNPWLTWKNWRRRRSGLHLVFEEYRFTLREVQRFLERTGFEVGAWYPNDFRPPRTEGIWVDYQNLYFNPWAPTSAEQLYLLPGWKRRFATLLHRISPWIACGEVTVVARAR